MKYLYFLFFVLLFHSCYSDIDLDRYREAEGENMLTLNSIINPDSTVSVSATRMFFYSDVHNEHIFVPDLDMELYVNSVFAEKMRFNPETGLYESATRPATGDEIRLQTTFMGATVKAVDVIPEKVTIESIAAELQGPIHIYVDDNYVLTYRITFSDRPDDENFYFLQYDDADIIHGAGERDFTYEFVFQQLARQINATLPGWEPYSSYGLPFSDSGIEGKTYTLTIREIQQGDGFMSFQKMNRIFKLYAISKPYYNYLVSIYSSSSDDGGIHGGVIDLGFAEPIKVYSNIEGGVGILCSYVVEPVVVDVFSLMGKGAK
ncbi:MAG: DUF4249 domain-containing protein [Tannerella sp.]|jgi:hypothetical protein|nr:DUF4249 domain-containing protein [Tannerella sp.]